MAGFEFSATNLFSFFGLLTPFMLVFFLLMTSIINHDIKVLIFILGTTVASFINVFLMNLIKSVRDENDVNPLCNVLSFPFTKNSNTQERYNSPSMTSMFISFTIAYILLPMSFNPPHSINLAFIIVLVVLLIIDVSVQYMWKCADFMGSFLGILVGFMLGAGWYGVISSAGYGSLLYYNDYTGNNTICKRPRKRIF